MLVPVAVFVALLIAPLVVSARAAFRHPMDVVVACSLSGAALSFGLSVVIQRGAFTHVQATAGDPAHVAFIALTLGFMQPIVFATAAMVAVLGLRSRGVNPVVGVIEGLVLVVLYELGTTLLAPYGIRGIVLTTLTAFVLAGAGLLAARNGLHAAMLADTGVGRVVAAIIAVVVLIAATVTAAVVRSGPATHPKPPGRSGGIIPHSAAAAAAIHPAMGRPGGNPLGDLELASTMTTLAVRTATTIDLGNGVTLTPAPGWTVTNQDQGWAVLANRDHSAVFGAGVGMADMPDINQEATASINAYIQSGGITNVQQNRVGQAQTVQGKNFQQALQVNFTGNVQTNQGTSQLYGQWVELFNPSTRLAGFATLQATSADALQAAVPDGGSMLTSMLSPPRVSV